MVSRAFEPLVIDGRYHVSRVIGDGALWRVYDAVDVRTRARVVVKRARHAGAITVARFVREVEIGMRLVHPNIVPLLDHGGIGNDDRYLVYAWIDGSTLEARLRDGGPLAWQAATSLAAQIAAALAAAHDIGIVHRDVKPSNIVIDAETKRPMLIDFNAFGEVGVDSADRFSTVGSAVVGTPAYMAPEQLTGQPQSPATDVYGLGMVLYEMLFGASPGGGSFAEIVSRILAGIEIPERADIPDALRQLLGEMLALDPGRRPQMSDVANRALAAAFSGAQRTASIAGPEYIAPTLSVHPAAKNPLSAIGAWTLGPASIPLPEAQPLRTTRPTLASRVVAPAPSRIWLLLGIAVMVLVLLAIPGLLQGIGMIVLGILLGVVITRQLARRGDAMEVDAARLLLGSDDPGKLTSKIVHEIRALMARSTEIDAQLLGATIIMMMNEVDRAEASADRQTALVRATKLFEKLRERLSPWYVRYSKQVGAIPAIVSAALGGVKIWVELRKLRG